MKTFWKIIIIAIAAMIGLRLIVMLFDRIEEKREREIFSQIKQNKRKEANNDDALCIEDFTGNKD